MNIPGCAQWQMMALIHNSTWTWLQKQKLLPLLGSYSVTAAKMVKDDQPIIHFWFSGYNLILIFSQPWSCHYQMSVQGVTKYSR